MNTCSEELYLNIAELCQATRALGPGLRAAIWVQGCPIGCKGCIAPDWIPFRKSHLFTPEEAGERMLRNPDIEGITISGGEPMVQAEALTAMLKYIRQKKHLHVLCFTGFRYEALLAWDVTRRIHEFLAEIDVLIDGPYVERLNNGYSFAGSSNQRMIDLTNERIMDNQSWTPRRMELHIRDRNILAVGIPPHSWIRDPISSIRLDRFSPVAEGK